MADISDILFCIAAGFSLLGVIAHELAGAPKVLRAAKDVGPS
jgi:hypothetical protein